jgi:transposase
MATIRKTKVGKYTYWQIVESKRVNGKPRPVVLAHLGTAEQLLYKLKGGEFKKKIKSYSHGACSVLWKIVNDMGLIELFDWTFSAQMREGTSVGKSLILGGLHRILEPGSKREFASFAKQTTLPRIASFEAEKLDSQFFWDQMDTVEEEQIEKAEYELTKMLIKKDLLSPKLLFYDMTNFFTFIATDNGKNTIAKRGKNKQRRDDLRQFGLSQVVTREFLIPVFSKAYQGNITDGKRFIPFLTDFRNKMTELSFNIEELTLVFDKGSNTKKNFNELDNMELPYVASVTSSYHEDLLSIPTVSYGEVVVNGKNIKCYRTKKEIWGKERTVVIYISKQLQEGQIRGFEHAKKKKLEELSKLKEKLASPHTKKKSYEDLEKEIACILKGEKVETVVKCHIIETSPSRFDIEWQEDTKAYKELISEVFGKKILITCRDEWSEREIISAYFGQYNVEHVFRQLKNPYHNAVRPQYHWTDQKIKVHTFMCMVGMLLTQLLRKISCEAGFSYSSDKIIEMLSGVRQAEIVTITDLKGKPSKQIQLEEMDEEVSNLYSALMEMNI